MLEMLSMLPALTLALTNPPNKAGCPRRTALAAVAGSATTLLCGAAPHTAHAAVVGDREVMTSVDLAVKPNQKPISVARRRFTGAGDPAWTYLERDLSAQLYPSDGWPAQWPYDGLDDFKRLDEAPDTDFYKVPKLVYHIDEGAVAALTHFYDKRIVDGSEILDICSSWVSHYPRDFPGRMKAIVGTGINELELKCNDQLTQYAQADLNVKPKLPFPDKSFDFVTCVVSFDYLNQPLAVMREVARVLRPGGQLILSQSNRCFFTKAVGVWTRDMSDAAHLRVLGTYIHFAGSFEEPRAFDISAKGVGTNDPMYVVTASRRA